MPEKEQGLVARCVRQQRRSGIVPHKAVKLQCIVAFRTSTVDVRCIRVKANGTPIDREVKSERSIPCLIRTSLYGTFPQARCHSSDNLFTEPPHRRLRSGA